MKSQNILLLIEVPQHQHGGTTYINNIIYSRLKNDKRFLFYIVNFSANVSEVSKFSIQKIIRNFKIIAKSWFIFFINKPVKVYLPLSATKFGIVRDFLLILPSVLFGGKKILHLHGFTYFKIYKESLLYRTILRVLDINSVYIGLCERQRLLVDSNFKKKTFVLYNTLNEDFYFKIKKKEKNKKKINLLYISNISKGKGQVDLINSVKHLNNIKLTLAGTLLNESKEFMDKFNKLIINNKDKIDYIGYADELMKMELFKKNDIFCMPSKLEEGSPVVIIEAMAHGLPIIAINKGCINEMIEGCGCIIDVFDELKFKIALEYVVSNYDILSKNCINNFNNKYKQDTFIKNFKDILTHC